MNAPERAGREGDSQDLPVGNDHPVIFDLVKADLDARLALGVKRYGQPLQPFNGRDALRDAYEEALDLAVYLRQALYEQTHPDGLSPEPPWESFEITIHGTGGALVRQVLTELLERFDEIPGDLYMMWPWARGVYEPVVAGLGQALLGLVERSPWSWEYAWFDDELSWHAGDKVFVFPGAWPPRSIPVPMVRMP